MNQAKANFQRISDFVNTESSKNGPRIELKKYQEKFEEAMNDDLNTPVALSVLYELITETNKSNPANAKEIIGFWEKMNKVFGLTISIEEEKAPEDIKKLAQERDSAKKIKDFNESDRIRKLIEEKGYVIEDTKEGYRIKKK
jgi:cysteinyl-tRNA synthetase